MIRTFRVLGLLVVVFLTTGCAGLSERAGFTLKGKPAEGTEAPWHNRALVGDVATLQCVEAIPVLMSRDPAWQIELRDTRREYEQAGTIVPTKRLVQRAVLYTKLGVRQLAAVIDGRQRRGYHILLPCQSVGQLLRGGELAFLVSADESRLLTLDGRVVWLEPGQKPWHLQDVWLRSTGSEIRTFTTFRRGEPYGDEVFATLEQMFPKRAVIEGVVYSVSADFTDVAQLTAGENGLDCLVSKGTLPVSGFGASATLAMNLVALPQNIKRATGNCYQMQRPEPTPKDVVSDPNVM